MGTSDSDTLLLLMNRAAFPHTALEQRQTLVMTVTASFASTAVGTHLMRERRAAPCSESSCADRWVVEVVYRVQRRSFAEAHAPRGLRGCALMSTTHQPPARESVGRTGVEMVCGLLELLALAA